MFRWRRISTRKGSYPIRSLNHEMLLQRERKSTICQIDAKRCYMIETENKPGTFYC